jgi:hypothetical protein
MKNPRSALELLPSKVPTCTTLGSAADTVGLVRAVPWVVLAALVGKPLPEVVRTAHPASERLKVSL